MVFWCIFLHSFQVYSFRYVSLSSFMRYIKNIFLSEERRRESVSVCLLVPSLCVVMCVSLAFRPSLFFLSLKTFLHRKCILNFGCFQDFRHILYKVSIFAVFAYAVVMPFPIYIHKVKFGLRVFDKPSITQEGF